MLAITPAAVEAVEAITAQADVQDDAALRITTAEAEEEGGQTLALSIVEEPEPGDAQVGATSVYVSEQAGEVLDDKVLDAEVEAGQVQFSVRPQTPGEDGAAPTA